MTNEEAIARAKEIERSLEYDREGNSIKYTYELIADALMEGYQDAMSEVKTHIQEKREHCSFKSGGAVCAELLYELFKED